MNETTWFRFCGLVAYFYALAFQKELKEAHFCESF